MFNTLIVVITAVVLTTGPTKAELDEYIVDICDQYEISQELVQAIVETESSYKVDAENGDCKGLMQISEKWHKDRMDKLDITDIMQPYCNIMLGVDYLAELIQENEDIGLALMLYNMKRSTAFDLYEKGEVSEYAVKVMERAAELRKLKYEKLGEEMRKWKESLLMESCSIY